MKKCCVPSRLAWAMLAAAVVLAAAPARADQVLQPDPEPEGGFIVRLGAAFPVAGTPDSAEFMLGVELEGITDEFLPISGAQSSLSLDLARITTQRLGRTRERTYVPVLLNYKWWSDPETSRGTAFGLGFGFAWADGRIDEMGIRHDLNFAWQGLFTTALGDSLRLDLRFIAGTSPRRDGLVVTQLGWRF